jgi:hypothetical protein
MSTPAEDNEDSRPVAVPSEVLSTKRGQETTANDKATLVPEPVTFVTPMTIKLPLTRQKRYNNFNIFFMLERQLILRTNGSGDDMFDVDIAKLPLDVRCYVDLYLPPLCSRYADLPLSPDKWFVQLLANKDKTRPNGGDLISFAEITRIVSSNYKQMDDETKAFVEDVAKRLFTCYDHVSRLWMTNNTRKEEVKKSNPRPQAIINGESQTYKKVVRGNIKGNKKTMSRSCNNSHQGVQPLITTPHAINNSNNINPHPPLQIENPSLTSISSELQHCLPTYLTMPPATASISSELQHCLPTYLTMPPATASISSELQHCLPTYLTMPPATASISSELQHCLPTYLTMPPATALTPQSYHHEIKMAQLQKELVHAMADRFEAERKFSIVKAQIMAEEARQARILEQQQQVKDDQMRCNIQYILSLRQGREIATTNTTNNGLTTLAVAASMPPFLDMTQRISEVVVAPPREQLFNQYNHRYSAEVAENDPQSSTIVSMTDRRGRLPSLAYHGGIQW